MGSLSIWHWLIFLVVALLFFGGSGKISGIMGDFAKGIKSFKKGLQDDADEVAQTEEAKKAAEQKAIEAQRVPSAQATSSGSKVG